VGTSSVYVKSGGKVSWMPGDREATIKARARETDKRAGKTKRARAAWIRSTLVVRLLVLKNDQLMVVL